MNETLLNDAERNYNRLLEAYVRTLKTRTGDAPVGLPLPDVTSPHPLARSLGLLEKMGEGFARAMDDDFNSREAVAKVLGMVREIGKVLGMDLDQADSNAFAHYAVDLLEETAGRVLGVLPSQEMALAEPEDDPRKAEIADRVEELLVQRGEARRNKDWSLADSIRDQLSELGVVVTDTASGPEWDLA
jgi:cysteinyl-tRNA synthetase